MEECYFKNNTPQWLFFTFLKLHKYYQIAQSITYHKYIKKHRCKKENIWTYKKSIFLDTKNELLIYKVNSSSRLKPASAIFIKFLFFHQMIAFQKLLKMLFI